VLQRTRMCLTIKLFWLKSALISFYNISVLRGRLSASRVLKLLRLLDIGTPFSTGG
jgi:hypothetical protein